MSKTKTQETSEIQVLEPVVDRYIFARPLQEDEAREVYKAVRGRVEKDFKNNLRFNDYFKFNDQTGEINGSNTYYGILINEVLSQSGLWLPTVTQARRLDKLGKLSNRVYRDFGIAVYDETNPNKEVAEKLAKEASKRGWDLPILVPFKALKPIKLSNSLIGAKIAFTRDGEEVITGEQARELLNEFDYRGNSGAQRLIRGWYGDWDADWCSLDGSNEGGRVDWICGEATQKNLEEAVLASIDNVAKQEVKRLNAKISSAQKAALDVLKQ